MITHNQATHEALRRLPYALYILGVGNEGETNAMAASWVTQCSFDPPLLMVAVRKDTHTYDLIKNSRAFTLNLLDKKHRDIVRALEKPFDMVNDKLNRVAHREGETGAPILDQAFAYIECRVVEIYEPGDHAIVVGEVVNASLREEGDPMMCSDLKWHYGG
ncbi:MAG: diguanylate cyclase [Verrucomicrobiales bacterium]|nr:diguanylate cyclase [Verrucomicrobiales bacterium]